MKKTHLLQPKYQSKASVRPDRISVYCESLDKDKQRCSNYTYYSNFLDNSHDGVMSKSARARLQQAVVWLLYRSKPKRITVAETGKSFTFRVNFITLTLPTQQRHTDQEIKNICLSNFFKLCAQQFDLSDYVWRAEAQLNGNIHFHITTGTYLPHKEIRRLWNQSLQLLGYIDEYEAKWHHRNPPTENVTAVKHVRDLTRYLSKYMAKDRRFAKIGELRKIDGEVVEVLYGSQQYREEDGGKKRGKVIGSVIAGPIRRIEGRLWFLSRSLSKCKPIALSEVDGDIDLITPLIQDGLLRKWDGEHATMYFGDVGKLARRKSPALYELLQQV